MLKFMFYNYLIIVKRKNHKTGPLNK